MKYDIFQCPSCRGKLGKSLKCCKKEFKGLNFLDEKAYKEDPLFEYYEKEYEKYYDLKKEAQNSKGKFKDIIRFLKKIKFNSVLDLGCGSGSFIANFKNLPKKQLYGTDISSPALSYAKKHFKGITFFRADCMKLPIKNKSVDVVTFTDLIEHVDNPRKLLKEIRRVSNYLILKVPLEDTVILNLYKKVQKTDWKKMMGHIHFWNEKSFKKLMHEEGFQEIYSFTPKTPPPTGRGSLKFETYILLSYLSYKVLPKALVQKLFTSSLYALYKAKK